MPKLSEGTIAQVVRAKPTTPTTISKLRNTPTMFTTIDSIRMVQMTPKSLEDRARTLRGAVLDIRIMIQTTRITKRDNTFCVLLTLSFFFFIRQKSCSFVLRQCVYLTLKKLALIYTLQLHDIKFWRLL